MSNGHPLVKEMLGCLRTEVADSPSTVALGSSLLPWSAAFESGHARIDAQHRELFALGNAVLEAAGPGCEREKFERALDDLFLHITRHFADEEALLAQRGYVHLAAHRHEHRLLLVRAAELEARAKSGQFTLSELADFLALDVVANHLLKSDKQYFGLFRDPA